MKRKPQLNKVQKEERYELILKTLGFREMTSSQLAAELGLDENAIRVNMAIMQNKKMLFTARYAKGKSGHQVSVYTSRVTPRFIPAQIGQQSWFSALVAA